MAGLVSSASVMLMILVAASGYAMDIPRATTGQTVEVTAIRGHMLMEKSQLCCMYFRANHEAGGGGDTVASFLGQDTFG